MLARRPSNAIELFGTGGELSPTTPASSSTTVNHSNIFAGRSDTVYHQTQDEKLPLYRFNVQQQEQQQEYELMLKPCYDFFKNYKPQPKHEREQEQTFQTRACLNWVKGVVFHNFCHEKRPIVLDLGCGYGQDVVKFSHLNASRVIFTDLVEQNLEEVTRRWRKSLYPYSASFICADVSSQQFWDRNITCFVSNPSRAKFEKRTAVVDQVLKQNELQNSVHLVSCCMMLQHICYSLEKVSQFFQNIEFVLKNGTGVAVCIYADHDKLLKKIQQQIESDQAKLEQTDKQEEQESSFCSIYQSHVSELCDESCLPYTMVLNGHLTTVEYALPKQKIDNIAKTSGLREIACYNLYNYYDTQSKRTKSHIVQDRFKLTGSFSAQEQEFLSLFNISVFKKNTNNLHASI